MASKHSELISHWRAVGPVAWAEGPHGWIGEDKRPIVLLDWQRAALDAWWEAREDVTAFAVSNVKKVGKTLLNAVLLAWRWLCLPGEHFAAGNDLDQSGGRQFAMIAEMVRRNPYLRANVTAGKTRLEFRPTGSVIVALAVDAAGNAGANHLTASSTEAWGILFEAGVRAWEELTPPPGRFYGLPALRIADSYAGFEGQSVTWHKLVDRGLAGARISDDWPIYRAGGLLLFHLDGETAQAQCFRGTPADAAVYYADQKEQLRANAYVRQHLNKRVSGEEAFVSLEAWDKCVDPAHRPLLPRSGERLFVGVDAATKSDSAAVVAVYFDSARGRVVLACHRIWTPTRQEPLDLTETIGAYLRELRSGYQLSTVLYDPYQMAALAGQLVKDGVPMREYPQSTPNLTAMGQNLFDLIQHGNLVAYADAELRKQVGNAVAVETPRGWRIAKEKASAKVDAVVALAMAALAAVETGSAPEAYGEIALADERAFEFSPQPY